MTTTTISELKATVKANTDAHAKTEQAVKDMEAQIKALQEQLKVLYGIEMDARKAVQESQKALAIATWKPTPKQREVIDTLKRPGAKLKERTWNDGYYAAWISDETGWHMTLRVSEATFAKFFDLGVIVRSPDFTCWTLSPKWAADK